VVALDDVSLTLEPGEFVVLTGPSGSGKTSLLSIIGDLDRPTSGLVEVDGIAIAESHDGYFHRDVVGFVFQHHHLLPHLPARVNVEIPLIGAGLGAAERRERANALLEEVGLGHRLDSLAVHLSGGERQRVAVARALANDPRLLLADEPTGALDRRNGETALALLEDLNRRGQTIVLVTHDEHLAEGRAHRIVHLVDGAIATDRPTRMAA
jgi:macrolide transport system ATP-binding/permease protein